MTDDQASDALEQIIAPVLELPIPSDTMLLAIWMELEAQFGELAHEAFDVELDPVKMSLRLGPKDRWLAEKLLKRFVSIGDA